MHWRDIERTIPSLADIRWSAPHQWKFSHRVATFCLGTSLSFACVWAMGDSYEEFEFATREAQRLIASNQAAEIADGRLRDMRVRLREVERRIEDSSQAFLLADELPDLLDLIARLSSEQRVALESLEVEKVLSRQRLDLQPLSLSLRGAYQDIGFLQVEFTNLPWPMVVDALQVTAEDGDGRVLQMRQRLLVPLLSAPAEV